MPLFLSAARKVKMNEIKKYYEILGCDETASDQEVREKYLALRKQCQNDMFLEGEAGNAAAKKLTEVQNAYDGICDYRKENAEALARGETADVYKKLETLIKAGDLSKAQSFLDDFDDRDAEWHYYQSIVFYKKNWINESKKQLEIAMQMNESEEKYKRAYDKMCKQMNFNNENQKKTDPHWNESGSGDSSRGGSYEEPADMMGGSDCMSFCCQSLACSFLLNCCCGRY